VSGGPVTLDLRGVPVEEADLTPALAHLREGGVLAYPTETVYGFGARCTRPRGGAPHS